MVGLDPNNPPPKNTTVVLAKWEYSDPVGVPHPDRVTLVVTPTTMEGGIRVTMRWKLGGWTAEQPVGQTSPGRYDIEVADYIDRYAPTVLRATIYVGGAKATVADLPIIRGD